MPPTSPTDNVIAAVRAEMARRKVSQGDLAADLGLSQSGVSRRLAGAVPFTVDELLAVAAVLDVPVAVLLGADNAAA